MTLFLRFSLWTFIFLASVVKAQDLVQGKITGEEDQILSNIQILNMNSGQKAYSDASGDFKITAHPGDELRFISKSYLRKELILTRADFDKPLNIKLDEFITLIPGVTFLNPEAVKRMKEKIGVPGTPENPREKANNLKDVLPLANGTLGLNIAALEQVVTGKARKMKALYRYEDQQNRLDRIVVLLGLDFFTRNTIPPEKGKDFLLFAEHKGAKISPENNAIELELTLSSYIDAYLKGGGSPRG